jgi:hypothetical protein
VAARKPSLRASGGRGGGTHRRKALRIWKATALARCPWKGSLAPSGTAGERPEDAGRRDRKCQCPDYAAGAGADKARRPVGHAPSGGGPQGGARVVMDTAGERDSNRATTRVWRLLRDSQSHRERRRHEACTRVYVEGRRPKRRSDRGDPLRSRAVGLNGCSLTTSRLQRLERDVLRTSGPHRFLREPVDTQGGSDSRRLMKSRDGRGADGREKAFRMAVSFLLRLTNHHPLHSH